ncbi:beta-lactamase [Aequoribacter fuscus]|uniref:Beta-lactamase n=1 Tax=Aequoribacter fuscus TaxID=2518989 RepID=F3L2G0_9GAMM|nr:serine hydrolase domain-containing protein [Aequoribacter fuscus]EGG29487.1 beta-lactamase [Aequoribacter fuscus]QHJ87315.1 class A beta-lactamase-related serine hydrolase [Aequoribacter fuscus]
MRISDRLVPSAFAILATVNLAFASSFGAAQAPEADTTNVLFLPQDVREKVFGNIRGAFPNRTVSTGNSVKVLNKAYQDFAELRYEVDGKQYSLQDFYARTATRGIIVVQGDDIKLEHYSPGHTEETRWVSFSVTKSLTSMLIGAAVKDGYIESVDEKVADYLPRLKGTSYEDVRIKDVLHMASGVAWNEDYADPKSDVALAGALNGIDLVQYLANLPKVAEPGTTFNYNTGETNLAGELLRSAIGNNASEYLEHKIWKPYGMEHDAYWLLSSEGGVETGGCCLNATLRDYARIGMFAKDQGVLPDGTGVLPEGWMKESTSPSEGFDGYGYLWWLFDDGSYSARGIFQQWIYIDPKRDLVIATHTNAAQAVEDEDHKHVAAVIQALRHAL